MIEEYKRFWLNAFDFKGRANRGEYWWPVLINFLIAILILIASGVSGDGETIFSGIYLLYLFAQIIPGISVVIRRLRDVGKHWSWYFIQIIPIIGGIWMIILLSRPPLPIA